MLLPDEAGDLKQDLEQIRAAEPTSCNRVRHAKSPKALFSMFIYIMHRTFAIRECESTLHHLNFRSLKIYKI